MKKNIYISENKKKKKKVVTSDLNPNVMCTAKSKNNSRHIDLE